jgi:hypothetical protein
MAGRVRLSAKRGMRERAQRPPRESIRPVAEEITVLVNTLRELAAIRATAEDAAGRILDSAENLLAAADQEEAEKAQEAILAIVTACGFHDLVGQRVSRIAESLDRMIAARDPAGTAVKRIAVPAKDGAPSLEDPGVSGQDQARIDALFGDN